MIRAIARKLRRWYRRTFQHQNYVFRHDGPFSTPPTFEFRFDRYERFEDIPGLVRQSIVTAEGEESLQKLHLEMTAGAVLWTAHHDDLLVGRRMSRQGRFFRAWFVTLADEDVVIFRGKTLPEHRGRGISPAMMKHIMASELKDGGVAYSDCRVYNYPSIRSLEKAGFRRFAKMRPISREQALGPRASPPAGPRLPSR
ncbi:MAG: GNAT family N-acetyltransferase [Gammaproteobacteria bacterium]|nr:GNAT family N-acetyltransferase [Gammaproteobacteria bacterium]